MSDPITTNIVVGLLTNLLWHPLCQALGSDTFRRLCILCDDPTRQRTFAKIFNTVRESLSADQRRYIDLLSDNKALRHNEGSELHKLFGGAEAPDMGRLAAAMRRLWPELPANLDAILAAFVHALETELRRHPDFAPWIAYREIADIQRMVDDIKRMVEAQATARPEVLPRPVPTVPAPVGDFEGREDDLDKLEAVLAADGNAVIAAVHGMGGVGKTEFAYLLAQRLKPRFPDGCLHLDMLGTQAIGLTPEAAMARMLQMLDPASRLPTDPGVLADAYRAALANRRLLILLDNARDTSQVRSLLPPAPVALMVTSRRRIVLPGSLPLELGPLPLPKAVGLLRSILRGDAPDDAMLADLAEACGRLPLALRAAGTFLLTYRWQHAAYLDTLRQRRLDLLAQAGDDDPALDVRAVIGLSYDRLAETDRDLATRFTQLAVFPAGFLADAAATVWSLPIEAAQVALDHLFVRSLVQREEISGRYRLHDLLRDLADEKLDDAAREKAAEQHASHYCKILYHSQVLLHGQHRFHVGEGLNLFQSEQTNVEAKLGATA